jgi:hypothetical protein
MCALSRRVPSPPTPSHPPPLPPSPLLSPPLPSSPSRRYDEMRKVDAVQIHVDVRPADDGAPMLLVRDNGGGMDRAAMHRMMSFGVSAESSKRIGRYGNGFKSSSMRLAADALVLSVSQGAQQLLPSLDRHVISRGMP